MTHDVLPETASEGRQPARRRARLVPLLGVLVTSIVGGVAAGWIWERVWSPPSGIAYQGRWALDGTGAQHAFDGTGWYVVIGALLGIVLGLIGAFWLRRTPLLGLAVSLVGAALAAVVMWQTGHLLGPPDPHDLARSAADLTPVEGDLRVQGWSAFLAAPAGSAAARLVASLLPGE